MARSFIKDPSAVLDYGFDWSDWLNTGETISSVVWTVPTGLTKDSQSNTSTIATVWLSSGTAGQSYQVACKIVTSVSRTDERSMMIIVENR